MQRGGFARLLLVLLQISHEQSAYRFIWFETIAKYKQVVRRLSQDLGRDPLPEEVATEMDLDVDKIYQIEKIDQNTVSLESPVGEDDDGKSTLGDFIADDKILSPDQESARRIIADQIKEILDDLPQKERKIL